MQQDLHKAFGRLAMQIELPDQILEHFRKNADKPSAQKAFNC